MAAARWWNRTAGERLIQEKPFLAFSRHNARHCSEIRLKKASAMTFKVITLQDVAAIAGKGISCPDRTA
jgi:hypothetical protein